MGIYYLGMFHSADENQSQEFNEVIGINWFLFSIYRWATDFSTLILWRNITEYLYSKTHRHALLGKNNEWSRVRHTVPDWQRHDFDFIKHGNSF